MNSILKFIIIASVLAGLNGCDNKEQPTLTVEAEDTVAVIEKTTTLPTPDNRSTDEILSAASALQDQAMELGHAWRTTADFISAANQLTVDGKSVQARTIALRAEFSANASIHQAQNEQTAWQDRFPK